MNTGKTVDCIHNGLSYTHLVEDIKSAFRQAYDVIELLPDDVQVQPLEIDFEELLSKAQKNVDELKEKILKEKEPVDK